MDCECHKYEDHSFTSDHHGSRLHFPLLHLRARRSDPILPLRDKVSEVSVVRNIEDHEHLPHLITGLARVHTHIRLKHNSVVNIKENVMFVEGKRFCRTIHILI